MSVNILADDKETGEVRGAVLYTDGSCKYTNPGYTGWGCHGYIYQSAKDKKPVIYNDHILTNHGYRHRQAESNHVDPSVAIDPIEYIDFLGSSLHLGSNNQAELQAVYYALERLSEHKLTHIHINSDSEYVLRGLAEQCKNWVAYGWKRPDGSYIPNHLWWEKLYNLVGVLRERGTHVNFRWVKGHVDVGNIRADILAGIGTNYSLAHRECDWHNFSAARNYWSREITRHPLLNFKRVYFNSIPQYNIPGQYFQADSGAADYLIGKRIPETGLSVVRLKEPEAVVEAVKSRQYRVSKDVNAIIMMKLDRVYSREVYPYLQDHGSFSLLDNRGNLNLSFFDKKTVTEEVSPTGLSLRAIDSLSFLEGLMDEYLQYKKTGFDDPKNFTQLREQEITNTFFEISQKQIKDKVMVSCKIRPDMIVGKRDVLQELDLEIDGQMRSVKVPLILGIDLPPRNNLKRLEDFNPRIFLLTWRQAKETLRYAVFVQSDIGHGIWSNHFADRIFLPPI